MLWEITYTPTLAYRLRIITTTISLGTYFRKLLRHISSSIQTIHKIRGRQVQSWKSRIYTKSSKTSVTPNSILPESSALQILTPNSCLNQFKASPKGIFEMGPVNKKALHKIEKIHLTEVTLNQTTLFSLSPPTLLTVSSFYRSLMRFQK
jgi:hypothetical protein